MRTHNWTGFCAVIGMMILIFDGETAIQGAQAGIELCLQTVIPSLFPFFLFSGLLTDSLLGSSIPFLHPIGDFCGIPRGAESILICAFLGGYPVGAQSVAEAFRKGQLTKKTADRMLSFCSNAGPAFIFGMVSTVFSQKWVPWALWLIQVISALLVSKLIRSCTDPPVCIPRRTPPNLSAALSSSIRVMASVCGWVVLFRILIAFADRWFLWHLPQDIRVILTGILELSNGCCELPRVANTSLRFVICSVILSFGGICVTMQTASVSKGLSLRYYFLGKLLQTALSLLLSLALIRRSVFVLIPIFPVLYFMKSKNKDSIPEAAVV